MKKILLIGAATLMVSNPTFAGGILTNTNQDVYKRQHIKHIREALRNSPYDIATVRGKGFKMFLYYSRAGRGRADDHRFVDEKHIVSR